MRFEQDGPFSVKEKVLRVFDKKAIPEHGNGSMTVYRNILVVWDEDFDKRVLDWIEHQPCQVIDELLVVSEHEGSLWLMWKRFVPDEYAAEKTVDAPDGDVWSIFESRVG